MGRQRLKLALIFDKLIRPDTTGIYCEKALRSLGHTVLYYPPLQRNADTSLAFTGYATLDPHCDAYIQIDDDLSYPGPTSFKPNLYWCIDTHRFHQMVGGWSREQKARGFDRIFTAQKDGVELFKARGFPRVHWLPLAFDPQAHFRMVNPIKKYDWCFVGNLNPDRRRCLQLLAKHWPNHFVGKAFGRDMVTIYNQSKIIFNYSIGNDLNMRIFEAMACGGLLVTNRTNNGEDELFGEALITYSDETELLSQFDFFLKNEEVRAQVAVQQYHAVHRDHTYERRMAAMIEIADASERQENSKSVPCPSTPPMAERRDRHAYRVCIVKPDAYVHSLCFYEVALLIKSALNSNGIECDLAYNQLAPDRINILLGYHLLKFDPALLNYCYIPYQLEQLSQHEGVFSENSRQILAHAYAVWDYAQENIELLRRFHIRARHLRIGYHESLEQIPLAATKDIDILFFGSLGDRRAFVLEQLRGLGINVKALFGVYGRERDDHIARSKLILNIHYYATQILETPRISYLLNNGCFILSEQSPVNPYPEVPLCLAPYDELVERCRYYLSAPDEVDQRRRLAYRQFKSHYPMTDLIRGVIESPESES